MQLRPRSAAELIAACPKPGNVPQLSQTVAIAHHFTVDENHHMLPDSSLLIENVPARSFVVLKVLVEYLSECRSRDLTRGTLHVSLDVTSESNRCHM